jgi:CubicO group peptidase (beta-lactamase class C family)
MRRLQYFLFFCVLFTLRSAEPAAAEKTPTAIAAEIDSFLQKTYPADRPGAAVLVIRRGETLLRKDYGLANVVRGIPIRPTDVFRIGSITKQFTAIAVLQLVQAGKVRLDDDVRRHLPAFSTSGQGITINQLLSHTSGLHDVSDDVPDKKQRETTQVVALIKDKPLEFAPGSDWAYHNINYRLLGGVVEQVSGKSYSDYMRENIFIPAGMSHTVVGENTTGELSRVSGYREEGKKFIEVERDDLVGAHAAGAILSSVEDLWKWEVALASGKLVDRSLLARASTPLRLPDGRSTRYGCGWFHGNLGRFLTVEHGGDIDGFSAHMMRLPDEQITIIVLGNRESPEIPSITVVDAIAYRLLGRGNVYREAMVGESFTSYTGVYRISPTEKIEIVTIDLGLALKGASGRTFPLVAISAGKFVSPETGTYHTFAKNEHGRVERLIFSERVGPEHIAARVDEPLVAPTINLPEHVLDRYVGVYQMENHRLEVRRRGGVLVVRVEGQPRLTLLAESNVRFRVKEVGAFAEFEVDDRGAATGIAWRQDRVNSRGRKQK